MPPKTRTTDSSADFANDFGTDFATEFATDVATDFAIDFATDFPQPLQQVHTRPLPKGSQTSPLFFFYYVNSY